MPWGSRPIINPNQHDGHGQHLIPAYSSGYEVLDHFYYGQGDNNQPEENDCRGHHVPELTKKRKPTLKKESRGVAAVERISIGINVFV